jgi:hypothetical protein
MLNLNSITFAAVVEKAAHDAANHPRWLTAIGRAILELDSNPWIERNHEGHGLLIGSPSGAVYSSNGICQCSAFEHGQACWHRAAARLVRLHDEARERIERDIDEQRMRDNLADGERIARKIAAQRATALLNECFA